jgi:hypothetical protein
VLCEPTPRPKNPANPGKRNKKPAPRGRFLV